jgi:hypothetical protein
LHETVNLADSPKPEHQAALRKLHQAVEEWIVATKDSGADDDYSLQPNKQNADLISLTEGKARLELIQFLPSCFPYSNFKDHFFFQTPAPVRCAAL